MIRKIVSIVTLASSISMAGISSVEASDICYKISAGSGSQLTFGDCSNVWHRLEASGKFPDIFSSQEPKLYPGLCFVSNGDISATLGNTDIKVTTFSAWTSEFAPAPFIPGGTDNLGSVITQWVVKAGHRVIGSISTHDSIDINTGSELDVITAGTGKLAGARGAIRVESQPEMGGNGQFTGNININSILGTLCLPD